MAILTIAGNWKMNTTLPEAKILIAQMRSPLESIVGVDKIVCPPFISLAAVKDLLQGSDIHLGAQNLHYESRGAFTGEISPSMLIDLCTFVIVGHSERRQLLGETDGQVSKKVKAALDVGLRPILCVGEILQEREEGRAESTVEAQLRAGLQGVASPERLMIAYEPIWAIGTGRAATPEVAQSMMAHMRAVVASLYGREQAAEVSLLYGGSANPDNILDFVRERDINGALVGGASLDADSFVQIVQKASRAAV